MREKLEELARLHAAATPGEWEAWALLGEAPVQVCNDELICCVAPDEKYHDSHAAFTGNANWIAASKNAFPDLLEYVRGLEAELEGLRDRCELYRLSASAREPEPQIYTTGGTWETPDLQTAQRLQEAR